MKDEIKNIKTAITLLQKTLAQLEGNLPVSTVKKQNGFRPPTHDQAKVRHYEMAYTFDLEEWFNHYRTNGWKVGKVPMKDWHSCMVQWQSRHKKANPERTQYKLDASGRPIIQNNNGQLI
jgi:hypothetical protein